MDLIIILGDHQNWIIPVIASSSHRQGSHQSDSVMELHTKRRHYRVVKECGRVWDDLRKDREKNTTTDAAVLA